MDRFSYLSRRLLLVIPTFLGITIVCFSLTRFLPGGPVDIQLAKLRAGSEGPAAATVAGGQMLVTEQYRKELMRLYCEEDLSLS